MSADTDADPAAPPAGDPRRYEIGDCVGQGGLGSVHRAWDAHLGRWVAIKRLSAAVDAGDPAAATARLHREANALAAFQHPHIVTVHDFGADTEGPFVVMEFIEGETLEAIVARAPLDLESFKVLAAQTLNAVEAAHRAGLLHRDLKPGNIMLAALPDGGFTVKVLDFGLAKFAPRPSAQTLDQGDGLFGSIYFMAPEQFRREPLDARTDLYALGAIFYFSLSGFHPFDGDTTAQVMAAHLEHRLLRPLSAVRPDLPHVVVKWVERLVSRVPTERPASAAAALSLAQPFLGEIPGRNRTREITPVPLGSKTPPGGGIPRSRWLPLGAGALALAAAGGLLASGKLASSRPAAAPPGQPEGTAASRMTPPAPVAPSPEATAAPASPAVIPEGTLAATDLPALRARLNETVTVTGTPLGIGQSRTGTVFYLNFGSRPHEGLAVVCFAKNGSSPSQEDFRPFVGRPIRVRGKLGDFKGDLQLVIDSPAAIRPGS